MARRRRSYGKKRTLTRRRLVLFLALAAIAVAIAFQMTQKKDSLNTNDPAGNDPGSGKITGNNTSVPNPDEPEITPPGTPPAGATQIASTTQMVDNQLLKTPGGNKNNPTTTDNNNPIAGSSNTNLNSGSNKVTSTLVETETPAIKLLKEGQAALNQRNYIKAREKLSQAFRLGLPDSKYLLARDLINKTSDGWLFSKQLFPTDMLCTTYQVQPGDNLSAIGKKFQVPHELIMRINGIRNARSLRAGARLKVIQGPFRVEIYLSKYRMSVWLGDIMVRGYDVTIGKIDPTTGKSCTPIGLWKVKLKQLDPEWTDPDTGKKYLSGDPDNPLGDHWIALDYLQGSASPTETSGIGIHGTSRPDEIKKAASHGCIRLYNGQVSELYNLLVVSKSQVEIDP